jgi:hypothetical protein
VGIRHGKRALWLTWMKMFPEKRLASSEFLDFSPSKWNSVEVSAVHTAAIEVDYPRVVFTPFQIRQYHILLMFLLHLPGTISGKLFICRKCYAQNILAKVEFLDIVKSRGCKCSCMTVNKEFVKLRFINCVVRKSTQLHPWKASLAHGGGCLS